jgi:hypothetical protein
MIQVNLLPHHLRPVKRTPVPYLLSIALLAVVLAACGWGYLSNARAISAVEDELAQERSLLASKKDVVDQYNRLTRQKKALAGKMTTITEIVSDRIIWSKELWNLAQLTPDNIWYDEILCKSQNFQQRIPMTDDSGKTTLKEVTVKRQVFEVSGYVVQGADGLMNVNPLVRATVDENNDFAKRFKFEFPTIKETTFEDFPVKHFTLEYVIQPGGAAND